MSETPADVIGAPKDAWDPMQDSDRAVHHWTTTNLGEAVPGVITPLGIAQWGPLGNRTAHRVAYRIGVFSAAELSPPADPADLVLRFFYGRLAFQLEYMASIGDRMPGVTGEEALASLFGKPPAGMGFRPTRRRYPAIALRLPRTFLAVPKMLTTVCPAYDTWWRAHVRTIPSLDLAGAIAAFADGVERFQVAMDTQVTAMLGSFQPVFDMLERLITGAGVGDLAILSGGGGAEIAVVSDIWKASRGELTVADIVANHGFHGPGEGEISSRVWRDDPSPLASVVEHYKALDDRENPALKEAAKERKRIAMTAEVLAALPRSQRPGARLVLKLARERIPDRGRAKRSFLQTIDVARMAARRAGEEFVACGVLDDREDVFYLTGDELRGELPRDVKELVAKRRERRATYQRIAFRSTEWGGMPDAVDVAELESEAEVDAGGDSDRFTGTGASSGIAEGTVRVVEDPAFTDVEPGEILVAATTDPSWCSIMFVSAALIVDLGGMLSHAAVVARELEIPCVVNTRNATQRLATGDRVRVDGKAGTVEILARAAPESQVF